MLIYYKVFQENLFRVKNLRSYEFCTSSTNSQTLLKEHSINVSVLAKSFYILICLNFREELKVKCSNMRYILCDLEYLNFSRIGKSKD